MLPTWFCSPSTIFSFLWTQRSGLGPLTVNFFHRTYKSAEVRSHIYNIHSGNGLNYTEFFSSLQYSCISYIPVSNLRHELEWYRKSWELTGKWKIGNRQHFIYTGHTCLCMCPWLPQKSINERCNFGYLGSPQHLEDMHNTSPYTIQGSCYGKTRWCKHFNIELHKEYEGNSTCSLEQRIKILFLPWFFCNTNYLRSLGMLYMTMHTCSHVHTEAHFSTFCTKVIKFHIFMNFLKTLCDVLWIWAVGIIIIVSLLLS